MSDALLTLDSISKWFGDNHKPNIVLDHIDLTIKEGQFVTILGKSGCGKSTLLRIIAGLIKPNGGEVLYQGHPYSPDHPKLAMVFQSHALYPWLTVLENVELGLEAMNLHPHVMRHRCLEAIDLIGLDGYESAYPKELSGGMRQRVGFARALVVNPDILLLDEPFSALDVLTADTIRTDLLELWIEKRIPTKAIIMVSHNVSESIEMSDRLVLLSHAPATIVDEIKIPLIYPRDASSQPFQAIVDRVYTALMTSPGPVNEGKRGEKRPSISLAHHLPNASIHKFMGLMDALFEAPYHGKADIYTLAEDDHLSIKESMPLFEAIDLLGFARLKEGDIELTDSGKTICGADILERKKLFCFHLLRHVPLAMHIYKSLQDHPHHQVSRKEFLEELEKYMSSREAEANLSVIINWGRYAEIFSYDTHTEKLTLETPNEEE